MIVLPQWNADAISHNALCSIFNWFGVAGLRLSMPYHDIRRPAELERADYAVSANIGRTFPLRARALPTFARQSTGWKRRATRSSGLSAPVSDRATPLSPVHMTDD